MYVTYQFWVDAVSCYRETGGDHFDNYRLTLERSAAQDLYDELKKEFG